MQLPPLPADVTELTVEASHESYDPVDEILALFRANTFFRNFEIKGPADRVLIYGILFISQAIATIKPSMGRRDAEKVRTPPHHKPRQTLSIKEQHDGQSVYASTSPDFCEKSEER